MTTRTGQNLSGNRLSAPQTFVSRFKEQIGASGVCGNFLPSKFANMDETPVIFVAESKTMAHLKKI